MGATFHDLLFLYWIFTTVKAYVAWTGDCDEKLLIAGGRELFQFCPETNATQVMAEGDFWKIRYSPRDGGTILAITDLYRSPKIVTFVQTDLGNAIWTPHTATPHDVAIDSVSGIVYVTYKGCGKIRALDLKRSSFSTVYEDPYGRAESIATASREGFLIWVHTFSVKSGRRLTSVVRARLDGTEVLVLINDLRSFGAHLVVDQKTSLVYWTSQSWPGIFSCDLEGNKMPKLDLLPTRGVFTVLDNILFFSGTLLGGLYRADVRKPEKQLVYPTGIVDVMREMLILPRRADNLDDSVENPCENNSCSHICVRSSNRTGHTCLCPDGYALERDGHSCNLVRRSLLVSTWMEGIWQVPIPNGNVSEPQRIVKTSINATGVQCDPVRRKIFWSEGNSQVTKILQLDMENLEQAPEVVFEHSGTVRASCEGLGAYALDWKTGNLYMAFNEQQRILVCGRENDSARYSKCAEFFSNKVGLFISALALDPTNGTMYLTQTDAEDSGVMRGGMDGSWLESLNKCDHPKSLTLRTNSIVYWLNHAPEKFEYFDPKTFGRWSFQLMNYKSSAHQRITFDSNSPYGTGPHTWSTSNSETIFNAKLNFKGKVEDQDSIEKYVDTQFRNVTGLWMCDVGFQWKKRDTTLGNGRQCAGLWLTNNGTDSFRCVCPVGFESHGTDGSSCKEIEEPPLIYSTNELGFRGYIKVKNGEKETDIYNSAGFIKIAFDPLRMELFWASSSQTGRLVLTNNSNKAAQIAAQTFPFPLEFKGVGWKMFSTPRPNCQSRADQLEYDWIGGNLYFVSSEGNSGRIELCSTGTNECTVVHRWSRTISEGTKSQPCIALDPQNGHMYWYTSDPGIWRGDMDGSGGTLIIPKAQPKAFTVDHTSKLLFWLIPNGEYTEVLYSDLNGRHVRQATRLHVSGDGIQVSGGRLWMIFFSRKDSTGGILSFDKETGDNLKVSVWTSSVGLHELVTDLRIQTPAEQFQTGRDVCILGALCSHMCIPTPSGYMRCLCPTGYKLKADRWTCECHDEKFCNVTIPDKRPHLRPSPVDPNSKETTQVVCRGNEFSCVGKCIVVDKLCNGVPDCGDFSDEGEGCNEACEIKQGCSHTCSRSPKGPLCFCPPDQTLATDQKGCVVVRVRTETVGLIVAAVVGLVLVIVIVLVTLKYRQTKRERDLLQTEFDEFVLGDPAAASVAPDGVDRALLLPFTKVILPKDIIIARDTKLGSGEFGVVHPGICYSKPAAIKVLKHSVDVDEFKAVLAEVKIMAYLGDHEFIVKFVGAEISEVRKRKIMIVTELSKNGDLLKYLWKVASVGLEAQTGMYENNAGNPSGVTILTLYTWCEQIATGMEYLAQKQIVHGDLAARNVLVFEENVVKIADFGLSKQLYGCSTYQMKRERKLPWKWSAIELLTSREFSEASDVWAFGVTAWEIFTLGQTPYKGIMIGNEFIQYIQAGNRLPKPPHASEEIFKVLLQCWDCEPRNRPNFQRLKVIFHDFVSDQRGCMQPLMNTVGSIYVTAV